MSLYAKLSLARNGFRLDLELDVQAGEVVALLGPNGAGKSTTLRALAGLETAGHAQVTVDDETWDDPAGHVHRPTESRSIGLVFQDYLLFPHLSALDNIAFGPRAHGIPRRAARALASEWLERVGLAEFASAMPAQLSGGQAQRVALARALAVRPRLLLLDEPLAALDASTRMEVRADLRKHLRTYDGVCLLVTHDPLDAMVLADRLLVLESGRVTHAGTPAEVAAAPRTEYVARLVGLNLYQGTAAGHSVRLPGEGELYIAEPAEGAVFAAFSPSAVSVFTDRPLGSSPRNCWQAEVMAVEQHGDVVRVRLAGAIPVLADVTPAAVADLDLLPGRTVWATVKATEIRAYPA